MHSRPFREYMVKLAANSVALGNELIFADQ